MDRFQNHVWLCVSTASGTEKGRAPLYCGCRWGRICSWKPTNWFPQGSVKCFKSFSHQLWRRLKIESKEKSSWSTLLCKVRYRCMYRYIVYTSLDKRDLRLFGVGLLFNIFRQSGAPQAQEGWRIPQNLVCLVRWGCSSVLNDVSGGLWGLYMFQIVLMMAIQQPSPPNKLIHLNVCLNSFWLQRSVLQIVFKSIWR